MNIVLTGAGRGIGYHTAKALCKYQIESLILISRNAENLKKLKEEILIINPDVRIICLANDLTSLVRNRETFIKMLNVDRIDILINNAGFLVNKSFTDFEKSEIEQIFDVNFFSAVELVRITLGLLKKSPSSHVLNISSMGGVQGSSKYPGLSFYSASKAALTVMTECLASEFANTTVRFNCLALGAVQTEMLADAFPGYEAPVDADTMGKYIADFALNGHKIYNGKILQVALTNP